MTTDLLSVTPTSKIYRMTVDVSGNTKTEALRTDGDLVVSIRTEGTWASASITFEVSIDGSTFMPLKDDAGTTITIVAGANTNTAFVIKPTWAIGNGGYVRFVSSAANAGATLLVGLRRVV